MKNQDYQSIKGISCNHKTLNRSSSSSFISFTKSKVQFCPYIYLIKELNNHLPYMSQTAHLLSCFLIILPLIDQILILETNTLKEYKLVIRYYVAQEKHFGLLEDVWIHNITTLLQNVYKVTFQNETILMELISTVDI